VAVSQGAQRNARKDRRTSQSFLCNEKHSHVRLILIL
jgi:hypothetical protein